ncbi:MAG: flagellar motor switch protein FliM [Chloroflexota bacterium]
MSAPGETGKKTLEQWEIDAMLAQRGRAGGQTAGSILAQWEIDSLLSSMEQASDRKPRSSGGRKIRLYDFLRPDKLSKEHLRSLQMLHETFARICSTTLGSYLRLPMSVQLSSVEQVLYDEYIEGLPSPTIVNIVSMEPLPGRAVIEYTLTTTMVALDRLLGGAGTAPAAPRELTEIEFSLLRTITNQLLAALRDAWSAIMELQPRVEDIVLSPALVQSALPGEVAALLVLEWHIMGTTGSISICIPYTMLEPVLPRLNAQTWLHGGSRLSGSGHRVALDGQLRTVQLPVVVELGRATVRFSELLELRPGDVIRLDTPAKGTLRLRIGRFGKFRCKPGRSGRGLAVRITEVMPPDEE